MEAADDGFCGWPECLSLIMLSIHHAAMVFCPDSTERYLDPRFTAL